MEDGVEVDDRSSVRKGLVLLRVKGLMSAVVVTHVVTVTWPVVGGSDDDGAITSGSSSTMRSVESCGSR